MDNDQEEYDHELDSAFLKQYQAGKSTIDSVLFTTDDSNEDEDTWLEDQIALDLVRTTARRK